MKCSEALPLLDPLCDGVLGAKDSALLLDHLKRCEDCNCHWNDLEELRATFSSARGQFDLPPELLDQIRRRLKEEERDEHWQWWRRHGLEASITAVAAIAAAILLIGMLVVPSVNTVESVSTTRPSAGASAETLVQDLLAEETVEPVADANQLRQKVGYELKHVNLPEWQMRREGIYRSGMEKSAVYKSPATVPIARFDFERKGNSGWQHLSCYQAPQGTIRTNTADLETLDGKRVCFGNQGELQFALWSQNGRDYLFVTPLTRTQLKEIVRGA